MPPVQHQDPPREQRLELGESGFPGATAHAGWTRGNCGQRDLPTSKNPEAKTPQGERFSDYLTWPQSAQIATGSVVKHLQGNLTSWPQQVRSRESGVGPGGVEVGEVRRFGTHSRGLVAVNCGVRNHVGGVGNYRQLRVWKQAHKLALEVYRSTETFPARERYGLAAQMRRAAVSVISNIAEGCGRQGDKELSRFLRIARGSVRELDCQMLLSRDLGYLCKEV